MSQEIKLDYGRLNLTKEDMLEAYKAGSIRFNEIPPEFVSDKLLELDNIYSTSEGIIFNKLVS